MTESFNLDDFIESVNQDKTKERSREDRLNKVFMNTRDHQGTVSIIPIMSKSTQNFYLKLPRVFEFYAETSLIDNGEAWYRLLPMEWYGDLSEDEIDLYNEVKGHMETLADNEIVSWDEFRVRNYSIFQGICDRLKNSKGEYIEKFEGKPCIFVYPSNSVIDALGVALNNKIEAMRGRKDWIPMILSPSNTGRKGIMMITFTKSAGIGYDSSVSFETNSEMNMVVDPEMVIEDKYIEMFDDILPNFLGWIYNYDENRYFNPVAFKELRDQLKQRVQVMDNAETAVPKDSQEVYENKNNLKDASRDEPAPEPKKRTPF